MITAGIDSGIENVKAVILKDGQVIARSMARSGGAGRADSAEQVWNEALAAAKLTPQDVGKVIATGQGKYDVKFANGTAVEPVADARAARFLFPSARSVIDIGADQTRVITLGEGNRITEVVMNQKCHAGLGIFLRSMARTLGMTVEQMCQVAGNPAAVVSDSCCVFAELDAIALIHNNTPKPDIIQAVHDAVATRINAVLNDKIVPAKDATILFGGVARNKGVIDSLRKRSGINFFIPDQPEYACALGAALIGAYQAEN